MTTTIGFKVWEEGKKVRPFMICAICRKPIGAREDWTRNTTGATFHRFACPLVLRPVISAPLPKGLSYPRGEKR